MKGYLRIIAVFLTAAAVLCASAFSASAEAYQKLYDGASLFSDSDAEEISARLEELNEQTRWDVIIYTNLNGVGASDMDRYCNEYYDDNGFGCGTKNSGVMLTVDMSSRRVQLTSKGDAMKYFTDERVDEILDEVQRCLSDSNYRGAAQSFISYTEKYFNEGIPAAGGYDNFVVDASSDFVLFCSYIFVSFLIALAVSLSVVFAIKRRYNRLAKADSYNLFENSHLNLTHSEDIFLTKNVVVTNIDNGPNHHGGGGHSGGGHSGGSSHGGGGRGF